MGQQIKLFLVAILLFSTPVYAQTYRISGINSPVRVKVHSPQDSPVTSTVVGIDTSLNVYVKGGDITLNNEVISIDDNGSTISVDDGAGSLTVDGTVAATQSGTWNINNVSGTISLPTGASTAANQTTLIGRFPAIAAAADNVTNPSISKIGSYGFWFDGTTWDRARGDSSNGLLVNLGSNNDITGTVTADAGTGTFQVEGEVAQGASFSSTNPIRIAGVDLFGNANTPTVYTGGGISGVAVIFSDILGNLVSATNAALFIGGDEANDAADAGNPVKIGGVARSTNPTKVGNADRVNAMFSREGQQVVILGKPRDLVSEGDTVLDSNTSETTILTAGGSGVFLDLTKLILTNTSNQSTIVNIRDASGGTVRLSLGLAAKGGAVIPFDVPMKQTTANNQWTIQSDDSVDDIRVFVQAVQNQ